MRNSTWNVTHDEVMEVFNVSQKRDMKVWVRESKRIITYISEGRNFVHTGGERCVMKTSGAVCYTLGYSLLCFGRPCCYSGASRCHDAGEKVTVPTSTHFWYREDMKHIIQPAFDHFKEKFDALMAIENPTRAQMQCRYKMVDWVVKTCKAIRLDMDRDLLPANVIDFLRNKGLITAN